MSSVMNSSVLVRNYAVTGAGTSELTAKLTSSISIPCVQSIRKLPAIKAQQPQAKAPHSQSQSQSQAREGRRAALLSLAGIVFTAATADSAANAGIIDEYIEKSKANKELNDKKRLATSGANFARAYTVEFGSCKFPENFTGCQDLAKQKKVPFISDDLSLECQGKDKYKCGSNVFWKW